MKKKNRFKQFSNLIKPLSSLQKKKVKGGIISVDSDAL